MTTHSTRRWVLISGAIGLVGGLAVGATGLAAAVSPSPSPGVRQHAAPGPDHPGMHRPGPAHRGLGGLVSALSDSSLTLRTPDGSRTIGLTGSTTFYEGPTKVTRAAVSVGELVRIRLADPGSTDPVASVVRVTPARLAGWVISTSSSTLTLKDVDGFTRTVATDGSTKVTKDGADSTTSAITVGSFLHAVGTVAGDGTTLQARHIGIGLPGKGKRHGPPPTDEDPDA